MNIDNLSTYLISRFDHKLLHWLAWCLCAFLFFNPRSSYLLLDSLLVHCFFIYLGANYTWIPWSIDQSNRFILFCGYAIFCFLATIY